MTSLLIVAGTCATGALVAGCSSDSNAPSAATSRSSAVTDAKATPRLDSAHNFRDIAGTGAGYLTTSGRHVRRGVVFRSNELTLSAKDVATVERLGVTRIYDLRTPAEVAAKPDAKIVGAVWVDDNVVGTENTKDTQFSSAAQARAVFQNLYRDYVRVAVSRREIAAVLTGIATSSGAQIVHCSAGKDRTGWVTVLLLTVAGVPQSTIDNNYLLSNTYLRPDIARAETATTVRFGRQVEAAYAPAFGVQQSFLDAGYSEVKKDFGSMQKYLTAGLGLAPSTLDKLRSRLVD